MITATIAMTSTGIMTHNAIVSPFDSSDGGACSSSSGPEKAEIIFGVR